MKVGVCFNCDLRHNGTAAYALRALKEMEGVEAFHVRTPCDDPPAADAYVSIDDGRDDIPWTPPSPSAYWAIDTHLGYEFRAYKARHHDHVFVAQQDAVPRLKHEGTKAHWLPLACWPEAHLNTSQFSERGIELTKEWDLAFVGFLNRGNGNGSNDRVAFLDGMFSAFPNSWLSVNVFFEEMALRYCKARLGLNISIKNDLNMRVFEVMCTGTPLLTNRDVLGIDEIFEEGTHYLGYEGLDEAVAVATEALEKPEETAKIGEQASLFARAHHTYAHRMRQMLEVF